MEFGVALHTAMTPEESVKLAAACEQWGLGYIFVPDQRFLREVYTTMTLIAMHTKRIKISTGVTDPFTRHPAMTAQAIATVDEISGGRACLGLGSGNSGMRQMQLPQPGKLQAVKEAAEVIRRLLRGEEVTYNGEVIKAAGLSLGFPVRPDIPIFVVGTGPAALKNAAQVGDGVITDYAGPHLVRLAWQRVEAGARECGRNPQDLKRILWLHTWIHPEGRRARDSARWFTAVITRMYAQAREKLGASPVPAALLNAAAKAHSLNDREAASAAVPFVTDELVYEHALCGTADEVVAQLRDLETVGVDLVVFYPWGVDDQPAMATAEALARQVMPRFG